MKKLLLLSAALITGVASLAQEVGQVVSSTPVIAQVGQPRNVCTTEQVLVQPPKSGAGALVGAIAGGAMGNAIGGGSGRAAATLIGIMGGAIVGDSIEGSAKAQPQGIQQCSVQTIYENRTVAYDVIYDYAGKRYSVQMPSDPGPTVQLQVAPVGATRQGVSTSGAATYAEPAILPPTSISTPPAVYPVYEQPVYYPPVRLNLGYGYWGGYGWHGRGR